MKILKSIFVFAFIAVFLSANFPFLPEIFKIKDANAAVYTLYFRNTNSVNPSTADILNEGYAGIGGVTTFARSGTAATNYYQLRPGITNTSSAASLPSTPTSYGWIWVNLANWSVSGPWTVFFNWQATNTALRGYLNYRITTVSSGAGQIRATLTPWTEEPTLLIPSAANVTQTLSVSAPITSQTLNSNTQYLYVEFFIRPTVGGTGSDGWKFEEETSKIVTSEILPIYGPNATGFINNTDGALTDGGRPSHQITVSGSNFGSGPCSEATGNNVVKIGSYIVPCANVSSWNPSLIIFTVPTGAGLPNGGSGGDGLRIRAAGVDDNSALTFWIFPRVTAITPPSSEAKQGDSVILTGDGFYGIAGTVSVNGASAILSAWTDVSISFNVPNGTIDGNIIVTKAAPNGKTSNSWAFKILPRITSIVSAGTNAGREYDALDSDGLVTLNGDHFRSIAGTITILGQAATVGGAWSDTQITNVQVPTAIADNSYSGNIVLTRATDSKTDTWSSFYILPRIISLNPNSAAPATSIQVNGNHFCGSVGTCPTAGNRSTAANNVVFNTTQAPDGNVTGWTNTQITVNVPNGASTGNVVATSNSYASNGKSFTVVTPIPNAPANFRQYKSDGSTVIAVAGGTNETTLVFKADLSASQNYNLALQVEVSPVATAFDGIGGDIYEGSAVAFSGTPVLGSVTVAGLTVGTNYHWRARIKNATTGTDFGSWVAFGNNPAGDGTGDGSPANADFYIDQGGPVISNISVGNITDTSAQITWDTNESATQQVEYGASTCNPGTNFNPASPSGSGTSHLVNLSGLVSNATYYYRVRSIDDSINETISPLAPNCNSFITVSANPIKTIEIFIDRQLGATSAGSPPVLTKTFSFYIPETAPGIRSAIIEISGISASFVGTQRINVDLRSGTGAYQSPGVDYSFDATAATPFSFLFDAYQAGSGQMASLITGTNTYTLYFGPRDATAYILSAKLILTYSYQ